MAESEQQPEMAFAEEAGFEEDQPHPDYAFEDVIEEEGPEEGDEVQLPRPYSRAGREWRKTTTSWGSR